MQQVVVSQETSSSRIQYFGKVLAICTVFGFLLALVYIHSVESFQGLDYHFVKISAPKAFNSLHDKAIYLKKNVSRSRTTHPTKVNNINKSTKNLSSTLIRMSPTEHSSPSDVLKESVKELTQKIYGGTNCPDNPRRKDLTRIMEFWADITKENNIEYMIFYGTLLGSIRNREVTPYDHDIDVLLNVSYYPLLRKIASKRGFDNGDGKVRLVMQQDFLNQTNPDLRKRFNCRGKSVSHFADWCSFQEPMARVITGNRFLDVTHFYDKGSYIVDIVDRIYQKDDIYPLKPCWLNGIKTYCPDKPEKLLKIYFKSDNLSPVYMCREGMWQDNNGKVVTQLS